MCRGRNLGKARASNKWLKKGTQSPGKEQKSSEIQPIIRAKLSLNYIDVQFQPRNSDLFHSYMGICTFEIEQVDMSGPPDFRDRNIKLDPLKNISLAKNVFVLVCVCVCCVCVHVCMCACVRVCVR